MYNLRRALTDAEINHLRRLLGYVRCEVGQSPEEYVETVRKIAPTFPEPDDGAEARLLEGYARSAAVPKYVRAAIKALEGVVREYVGEIVDVQPAEPEAGAKKIAKLT